MIGQCGELQAARRTIPIGSVQPKKLLRHALIGKKQAREYR
jgi:hypothetical protein